MTSVESRSASAVRTLARMLLSLDGENLPPTSVLAEQAGVGIATVTKALNFLREHDALAVVRVQRYGTLIKHLDRGLLWNYAGYGPLRGTFPMSLSPAMQSLVRAIAHALETCGLQVSLTYQAGASKRLALLHAGDADFTVISKPVLAQASGVTVTHEFPAGSYYGSTDIYRLLPRPPRKIERVGADPFSPDHSALVQAEFPGATVIATPFHHIPACIATGAIDASIWYGGAVVAGKYLNHLQTEPATSPGAEELKKAPAALITLTNSIAYCLLHSLDGTLLDQTYIQAITSNAEDWLS